MVAIEVVRLSPEVASMLMVRNREALPLCWQNQPNRRGRNALEEMSDERLFGDAVFLDDRLKTTIRALLYLWNGYPDQATECVRSAPCGEGLYLIALANRMLGRWPAAEEVFSRLPEQPFLPTLLSCAKEICTACGSQLMVSVQEVFEQLQKWDHQLFTALFQQAAAGQIGLAGEHVVSQIQYSEFELLFSHCYEKTTGTRVLIETRKQSESAAMKLRKREPAKKSASSRSQRAEVLAVESKHRTAVVNDSKGKTQSPAREDPPAFRVSCPSCRATIMLPAGARGTKSRCGRCGGLFVVSRKEAPVSGCAAGGAALSAVVIACPICQTMHDLPPSARGTNRRCSRCGTVFSVGAK